jgi:hypothetical protein
MSFDSGVERPLSERDDLREVLRVVRIQSEGDSAVVPEQLERWRVQREPAGVPVREDDAVVGLDGVDRGRRPDDEHGRAEFASVPDEVCVQVVPPLVTLFLPERGYDLHADLVADARELGATVLVVGSAAAVDAVEADHSVVLPDRDTGRLPLYTPAFQLLGYYRAVALGLKPDDPQNLSQVVTL